MMVFACVFAGYLFSGRFHLETDTHFDRLGEVYLKLFGYKVPSMFDADRPAMLIRECRRLGSQNSTVSVAF